jgi:putative transposase
VLIACCDGLIGLPDALEATWPRVVVQTCVVHLIRGSTRFCNWKDRKPVVGALKPIYTAPSVQAAEAALEHFDDLWGERYPGIVKLWRDCWDRFVPFLDYPRRDAPGHLHDEHDREHQLPAPQGHQEPGSVPVGPIRVEAALHRRHPHQQQERRQPGTGSHGWHAALNAFAIHFPGRLIIE